MVLVDGNTTKSWHMPRTVVGCVKPVIACACEDSALRAIPRRLIPVVEATQEISPSADDAPIEAISSPPLPLSGSAGASVAIVTHVCPDSGAIASHFSSTGSVLCPAEHTIRVSDGVSLADDTRSEGSVQVVQSECPLPEEERVELVSGQRCRCPGCPYGVHGG